MFSFVTTDTCSKRIDFDIDAEGRVHNVCFAGGCPGNATGIARLVEGRRAQELIDTLGHIGCGKKATSCPDQLAQALKQAIAEDGG